jgi:hypothetical protein
MTMESRARQVRRDVRESADAGWLRTFGRVGFAAVGVVWFLLGWVALQLALGDASSGEATQSGALAQLASTGIGRALLVLMAAGLVAYGLWQASEALWGYQRRSGSERTRKRVGSAVKVVVAGVLTATIADLLLGGAGGDDGTEESATATALATPGGVVLVVAVGAVLVGLGGYWVYRGVTARFREKFEPGVDERLITFGRVGHVGRGVAVGALGVIVALAALRRDPERAGGIDEALTAIFALPYGTALLAAVAVGLMAFGVYQVLGARHAVEG